MILYDLFDDSKADTGTGILLIGMQPLKYLKDPLAEFRFKAYPIITDTQVTIFFPGRKPCVVQLASQHDPGRYYYMCRNCRV